MVGSGRVCFLNPTSGTDFVTTNLVLDRDPAPNEVNSILSQRHLRLADQKYASLNRPAYLGTRQESLNREAGCPVSAVMLWTFVAAGTVGFLAVFSGQLQGAPAMLTIGAILVGGLNLLKACGRSSTGR